MSKPRKHTLLLVFIHGFKGTDHTFHRFPSDLRALIAHSLPAINVLAIQYPQYETRGDLKDCVGKLKEWLQNKVIDLEVANQTPSPTVDPSVHVMLCGHSMGGIVAAEALLSIARDEVVPSEHRFGQNATHNATSSDERHKDTTASSALFFPRIKAVLAFDTPYLGISPGVLAHGAEEQIGHANKAYQAYDQAASFFGWGGNKAAAAVAEPMANASSRGLPAPGNATAAVPGGFKWGKLAMYAGAAAGIAGVAGAAYLSWNQINQGLAWAGSHLEFVGCLARGAELQKRVEKVVALTSTHDVGFANFFTALDGKVTSSKTKYAGQLLGADRTFCVVPKPKRTTNRNASSPTGTKRVSPDDVDSDDAAPSAKKRKPTADTAEHEKLEAESEQVRAFADDRSKSKGRWVKCVNSLAQDEIAAHQNMFTPGLNPDYHAMVPRARDQVLKWVDWGWYERSGRKGDGDVAGGEEDEREEEDTDVVDVDDVDVNDDKVDDGAPDREEVVMPTSTARYIAR